MYFGTRVSQTFVMQISRTWKQAALSGLLTLALIGFAGARSASAQVDPQPGVNCLGAGNPGPSMTIQFFNNSTDYNIFPLLLAGTQSKNDEWMEACFRILANQFPPAPIPSTFYPRFGQYRLYINCCGGGETGIPPGGSVELKLPLYSPLVQTIFQDPAKSGQPIEQFIDWWQGGNINIYAVPVGGGYPPSLATHWNEDTKPELKRTRNPTRNAPTCRGLNGATPNCGLHAFLSAGGIVGWEPQQLVEYTLGAAGEDAARKTDAQPLRIWNPENVDYDVSSVNNVYLPSAMLPFGNTLNGTCCAIGYVGTLATIDATLTAIDSWRSSSLGKAWPRYVDQSVPPTERTVPPAFTRRKVPSPLEIFTVVQDNKGSFNDAWNTTSQFSPAPAASPQIIRMKALFEQCFNGQKSQICGPLNDVTALLQANYANYAAVYDQYLQRTSNTWTDVWGCTLPGVRPLTTPLILAQLYGWNGFNALSGCNAKVNRLEQTPGYKPGDPGYLKGDPRHDYQAAKAQFDHLHYWFNDFRLTGDYGQWEAGEMPDYGQFNPYVGLIHGSAPFMNAPYMYAYSVDDAFGNMQTDGTGLKILVGGPTSGEPVPNPVTHEVQFATGYKTIIAPNNPFAGLIMTNDTYSRCGGAVTQFNPRNEANPFTTFVVPQGAENATPTAPPPNSVLQCQITMKDSTGRVYTVKLKDFPTKFPKPIPNQTRNTNCGNLPAPCPDPWPNATQITQINQQFVDCSANSSPSDQLDYCKNIYIYQDVDATNAHLPPLYHVSMGAPPPCNTNTSAGYNPAPCIAACTKQGASCQK